MRPAASTRRRPKAGREGATNTGTALAVGVMALLPRCDVGEAAVPAGRGPDEPAWRCQMLWCEVILLAVADSLSRDQPRSQPDRDERRPGFAKRRARSWLRRERPVSPLLLVGAQRRL
jgi:hypothetical protein